MKKVTSRAQAPQTPQPWWKSEFFSSTEFVMGSLVVSLVLIGILAIWLTGGGARDVSLATIPQELLAEVKEYPNVSRSHQQGQLTFDPIPPVGGAHNPTWLNCGVYEEAVPNEYAVHSLEHGAMWITYQPDLPAEQIAQLQTFTLQTGYRLLSPYAGISRPIFASAWGVQMPLDQYDEAKLNAFSQKYENRPDGPEPGAVCSGGTGQP